MLAISFISEAIHHHNSLAGFLLLYTMPPNKTANACAIIDKLIHAAIDI